MNRLKRKAGFSLSELLVAMAVIMVLAGVAVPTIRHLIDAFESPKSIKNLVGAALANARAMAIRDSSYVGVRFQRAYDPQNPANPLKWPQYMVFIIHDEPVTDKANGFRVMAGRQPIKLPKSMGIMDLMVRYDVVAAVTIDDRPLIASHLNDDPGVANIDPGGANRCLTDTSCFSIVFSPAGKLVIHDVWVKNKQPKSLWTANANDSVFNTMDAVIAGDAMFRQDYYPPYGLGQEASRNNFLIYDIAEFEKIRVTTSMTYSDVANARLAYLESLSRVYVSPYTGEIINK
ncbi:MAG: prepilin-type N-terminal cleavage/methylation domain-containing protein [Planctomycetes bacterium]|nr:prepilin-type N-terminal cleavage/methylation domain-containing protein [Planctomycetota bacterium]